MGSSLEQYSSRCHDLLKAEPGPKGREKVRAVVEEMLRDEPFVSKYLAEGTPERKVIYEDPELRFCILAHAYTGAKESAPHDHGPSWAIYGQARGETIMTDWALVEKATESKTGKVKHVRSYVMTPGTARVYNEGDLHSPKREAPTRLIRIEGQNLDKVKRLKYERV